MKECLQQNEKKKVLKKKTRKRSRIMAMLATASLILCLMPATVHADPDPVSTTDSLYGYQGELQEDVLSDTPFEMVTGKYEVSGIQRLVTDGYAASASGKSTLALGSSYLRSETEAEAAPAEGRFEDLLVSGSLNAVQGLGTSQSFYINSSLITRSGAAAMLDKASANEAQQLSLYLYGSEAIAADGGFGANSDLFSRLYVYGSHIQAAEAGILTGTNSNLIIGTIKDGEENSAISEKLEDSEKNRWSDKGTGSVIEGGRNALVIYSENLPEYWEYEGYSEDELLTKSTTISAKGSTFRTDPSLDKGVSYGEAQDGYINHTTGSVVLIKSTNAAITLEDCELIAGKDGEGTLIHTVINNDIENMSAIAEDFNAPGVNISMRDMDVKGNIIHEDYQRNLGLTLINTKLSGSIIGYDAVHWNNAAAQEGFKDYCPDEAYDARRIAALAVTQGSSWTPTAESHLGWLYIDDTSNVTGKILVDGVEKGNLQGSTYIGDIVIIPSDTSSAPAVHEHNWVESGGYPPVCEYNGMKVYYCSICGAEYDEIIPAPGHNWVESGGYPPVCEYNGMKVYYCSVCGAEYDEIIPATGHHWERWGGSPPDCLHNGAKCYVCTNPGCGATYDEILPALDPINGHSFGSYQPTIGDETSTHTRYCITCGAELEGARGNHYASSPGGGCDFCGYSGAYG